MPECFREGWAGEQRECPRCGWKLISLPEPNTGDLMWLCSGSECGILMNDDMQPVDIAPDYTGGDYQVDRLRERGDEMAADRHAQQQARQRAAGLAGDSTY